MNTRCQLTLLGLVVVAAACGSSRPPADRFAGTWKLNDGRTITLVRGGAKCSGDAVPYNATYFGGKAHLRGCANGNLLRARFNDNGITGTITQRLDGNDRWVATIKGDGARPFRIVASRVSG